MSGNLAGAEACFNAAVERMAAGDAPGAAAEFRQALVLDPTLAEAHANLALLAEQDKRIDEAEAHYRAALLLAPDHVLILSNFGALLMDGNRSAEAEGVLREALRQDPAHAGAWTNLGVLLACLGREQEAEDCHRRALVLEPAYRKARFNLAYLLLRQGRYEEGWAAFEARDWHAAFERWLPCPRWRGEALAGRRLLVCGEGGLGDTIQFCRYALQLKLLGAVRVGILCHPPLRRLLTTLAGVDLVLDFDAPGSPADWDLWVPVMSLPYLSDTRLDSIPAPIPYLAADPALAACWAQRFGPDDGYRRIGLAWKGSPAHENDSLRSLPSLATLASLASIPDIRWFSLQKGAGEDELAAGAAPFALQNLGAKLGDMADTAAAIASLDLVITVDTAVAHLAGALGIPCWVLLPAWKPDWRWLAGRQDSPWYAASFRLFRQQVPGDWAPVVAQMASALATPAAGRR